jgi:DNA-binding FrmR family transcriptional regulator
MKTVELGQETVTGTVQRLRKVEGQVRALQRMMEEGRDCEDVLRQIAAATGALRRAGVNLAVSGLQHCVMDSATDAADLDTFRRSLLALS